MIVLQAAGPGKPGWKAYTGQYQYDFEAGDKAGLVGANGSGKTTLLKCLSGQLEPEQGHVMLGRHSSWAT